MALKKNGSKRAPVVEFSSDTPEFAFLLNEHASPFYKNDRMWQSAMQYIAYHMFNPKGMDKKQATNNRALRDKIVGAFDPFKCRYFLTAKGREANKAVLRDDHEEALPKVLKAAVREKFGQNPMMLHLLLQTKGKLIYANKYDEVLGTGRDGKGQNLLGKTIEKLRDQILSDYAFSESEPTAVFTICAELSEHIFTGDK